jgi:hypothetical protein
VAVGNEATVDWTDHFVPVPRMIEYVRRVKAAVRQPVTFCENYVPWQDKLRDLVAELDFISLHTYPVWEYKHIHEALDYTKDNVASVARLYPGKPIVITEAGWCTNSNGRGMHAEQRGAGTAGRVLPGPDGLDPRAGPAVLRLRGLRREPGRARPTRWSPRSTGACSPSTAGPSW